MRLIVKIREGTKRVTKGRIRTVYRRCQICGSRRIVEDMFVCLACYQLVCQDCKEKQADARNKMVLKVALEPIALTSFESLRKPIILVIPIRQPDEEKKLWYSQTTTTTQGRQKKPNSKYFSEAWINI